MGLQEARGFLVTDVAAEGTANKAGIQGGDFLRIFLHNRHIYYMILLNINDRSHRTGITLLKDVVQPRMHRR